MSLPLQSIVRPKPLCLLLLMVVVFGCAWLHTERPSVSGFVLSETPPSSTQADSEPFFQTHFASSSVDDYVHSASLAPLPDGGLMAVWFAGSREGASDVDIRASRFDVDSQEWTPEFILVERESTEPVLQRYIRKLGNPVIALAPDKRLWLFYVSVSVGGWAGSSINTMHSDDSGVTWSPPRRLITSPFLNISTLVRNSPVFHQDGSIGLPVYHEFLGKFAEYLRLSPDGKILDKFRISDGRYSLQPSVVPLSGDAALALLRNAGKKPGKVLASFTHDRGQTWSEPIAVQPWNPNSSLAAIGLQNAEKSILVALNNLRDGRHRLSLYETDAQLENWRLRKVLDEGPDPDGRPLPPEQYRSSISKDYRAVGGRKNEEGLTAYLSHLDRVHQKGRGFEFEYEYPNFLLTGDRFHVIYSWNNSLIKHVSFNRAWLEMQQ
ncbi:MAG: sialidase family protein [Desulfuromonadales bacterium]